MSSTSDERLMNVLGQAQQNLIKAKDPTPCVMISEENWKSIIETLQALFSEFVFMIVYNH